MGAREFNFQIERLSAVNRLGGLEIKGRFAPWPKKATTFGPKSVFVMKRFF